MLQEGKFSNRDGIQLHYMEQTSYDSDLKPVLIIPALPESDMDWKDIIYLIQNHTVCATWRGRELSDAPETGYSLKDHANDIIDTIEHFKLNEIIVIAYSRGITYLLEALSEIKDKILGILLVEYPAEYLEYPTDDWAEKFLNRSYRAMPNKERFPKHWVLERIQEESKPEKLWSKLIDVSCPVTLFAGVAQYSDPALISTKLNDEYIAKYKMYIPQIKVVMFEESGHDLRLWEYDKFIKQIRLFIEEVSPKSKAFLKQQAKKKKEPSGKKTLFGLEREKEIRLN